MARKTTKVQFRKFLFIPTAHGPGHYNVHDLTCRDCRREWNTNNSQGRKSWDEGDVVTAVDGEAAVKGFIADLEEGGFEPGSFTRGDFWLHPCCKK